MESTLLGKKKSKFNRGIAIALTLVLLLSFTPSSFGKSLNNPKELQSLINKNNQQEKIEKNLPVKNYIPDEVAAKLKPE